MVKKMILILCIFLLSANMSCAWENLPEGGARKEKIIQVTMRCGGPLRSNLFYYIVFNLSGKPDNKPYSVFNGDERGKFWNVYYMYGTPPYRPTGLYRGLGGKGISGGNLIEREPVEQGYLTELLPGTMVSGDTMTLRIDLTDFPTGIINSLNMNMIVCNQAIDATSRLEYEYDPFVFDSFYGRGITLNVNGSDDWWSESNPTNEMERIPNEHEDIAPPEANIISWTFQKVSW